MQSITLVRVFGQNGVEPYAYLKDVLERLPYCTNQNVNQLTPRNWQQAQEASPKRAA